MCSRTKSFLGCSALGLMRPASDRSHQNLPLKPIYLRAFLFTCMFRLPAPTIPPSFQIPAYCPHSRTSVFEFAHLTVCFLAISCGLYTAIQWLLKTTYNSFENWRRRMKALMRHVRSSRISLNDGWLPGGREVNEKDKLCGGWFVPITEKRVVGRDGVLALQREKEELVVCYWLDGSPYRRRVRLKLCSWPFPISIALFHILVGCLNCDKNGDKRFSFKNHMIIDWSLCFARCRS